MRADRLISILMLIQGRGRVTARQLAEELEVSERTILRDMDALSAAGVPVYAERGPQGGFQLWDSYRTDLTGLTDSELRAVFLLTIPGALADLGLDRALASALQKFAASIHDRRNPGVRMRERYYLDPDSWHSRALHAPHFHALMNAVNREYRTRIAYRLPSGPAVEQWIHPYGLVASDGAWYVVYLPEVDQPVAAGRDAGELPGRFQALPLSALTNVYAPWESFTRRQDFDLVKVWEAWRKAGERPPYGLWLLAPPDCAPRLDALGLPCRVWRGAPPYPDGRVLIAAIAESFEDARAKVLTLGGAVEVVAPEPLRRSVLDYAEQVTSRYAMPPAPHPDLPPAEIAQRPPGTRSPRLD